MFWRKKRKRKKVGLALGGGSVRGAAHLGVLEVLEQEGIRPDYVAGVSAGSVVGAVYCAGLDLDEMKRLASDLQWRKLGRVTRPRLGFFDGKPLEGYLEEVIGPHQFEDLEIPFAAVAVDIVRGELVVLSEGPVAPAVRASCAIPGIFTPVERGEQMLVDGGVLNNLPVSVAREMGADYVIAVDLLPPTIWGARPRNLFEMFHLSFYTLLRAAHSEAPVADCLIVPAIGRFTLWDFSQVDALIEKGREAAETKIEQIKQDLEL
ncbi:MAG: patatin-like phospholipase family protein [Anaerolineales bacterium]|nr:patatin-like phospholipase family protein [Anaerolineales bacterium]